MGKNYTLIALLAVLFFMAGASALGVTPGRTPMDFQPGVEKTISFTIINSQHEDINLQIDSQGELKDSVDFGGGRKSMNVSLKANDAQKEISYKIKLPDKLEPGEHTADIVIQKIPGQSEANGNYVEASVAVITQISVMVVYPGKYVEAELNVVPSGDGIAFVIPITSKGNFDIVSAKAVIDIYTGLNEKVASVTAGDIGIKSQEKKEIVAQWKPNVLPGPYRAVATLIYDEQTMKLEKEFNVGNSELELQNVEVNGFSLGQIAKFEMLVENKWSEPIQGAYAQTNIFDDNGKLMVDFKSPAYDIPAMTKNLMISYWDTAGVREGTYNASIYLKYGDKSSERNVQMEVKQNEINVIGLGYVISQSGGSGGGLTTILIVIIAVLVILNAVWFLMLRKYLARKSKG